MGSPSGGADSSSGSGGTDGGGPSGNDNDNDRGGPSGSDNNNDDDRGGPSSNDNDDDRGKTSGSDSKSESSDRGMTGSERAAAAFDNAMSSAAQGPAAEDDEDDGSKTADRSAEAAAQAAASQSHHANEFDGLGPSGGPVGIDDHEHANEFDGLGPSGGPLSGDASRNSHRGYGPDDTLAGGIDDGVNAGLDDAARNHHPANEFSGLGPSGGPAVTDEAATSDEYCTIEVASKTISGVGPVETGPFGVGPFDVGPFDIGRVEVGPIEQPAHAYVVTTDSVPRPDAYLGPETIHRGGPEANRTDSPVDGSVWGDIVTDSTKAQDSLDYSDEERQSVTVGVFEGNCDPYDRTLEQAGIDIEDEHHDYSPTGPNSNTAASEMLERSGLPVPDDYPGWTPGSDMDLPDDKPPTNPDRSDDWFWERAL